MRRDLSMGTCAIRREDVDDHLVPILELTEDQLKPGDEIGTRSLSGLRSGRSSS